VLLPLLLVISCAAEDLGHRNSTLQALALCHEQPLKTLAPGLLAQQEIVRLLVNDGVSGLHVITIHFNKDEVVLKHCRVGFALRSVNDLHASPTHAEIKTTRKFSGMQAFNLRELWKGMSFFKLPQSIPQRGSPQDGPEIIIEATKLNNYWMIDRSFILDMRIEATSSFRETNVKSFIIYACGLADADLLLFQKYVGP